MEKKFTPGNWFINRDSFDCGPDKLSIEVKQDDNFYFIAQVDGSVYQEANAQLITAAPELLEALEAITKLVIVMNDSKVFPFAMHVEQAQKAIAKAYGKE